MKTAGDYLNEANAVVPRIPSEEAITKHTEGGGVFIDVRDSSDVTSTGTIQDALRIPRGFLEFAADDNTPYHNKALQKDTAIYVVCAVGGQAALAGKTLKDMGYTNVTNIGGIGDWKDAGGPTEA